MGFGFGVLLAFAISVSRPLLHGVSNLHKTVCALENTSSSHTPGESFGRNCLSNEGCEHGAGPEMKYLPHFIAVSSGRLRSEENRFGR